MEAKEILEGNFIIAKFMGGVYDGTKYFVFKEQNNRHLIHGDLYDSQLKYHSSWDWLMPVVEKIHSTPAVIFEFTIALIPFCRIMYTPKNQPHKIFMSEERNDITGMEAIYQAVIQFIYWYNTNKQL